MIRARVEGADGRPGILLGLSRENIRRLVELNQPIRVTGDSLELPAIADIVICFGETERALVDELEAAGLLKGTRIVEESSPPPGTTR